MATRKRGRPKARPAEEELELEEQLAPAGGAFELEDDFIGELEEDDGRYVVAIWRRVETGPKVGKPEYLGRQSPAEFSLDGVRDRFGGGTYEFRVLRKDERGKEKYFRTRTMVLAGAPKNDTLPPGGPVAIVGPPSSERERVLEERLRQQSRAIRRLAHRLERPPVDPLAMVEKLTATLATIMGGGGKRGGGAAEFVEMVKLGVTLANRGGGGEPDPLGQFLGSVTQPFISALTDGRQNGAARSSSETAPGSAPGTGNGAASAGNPPAVHKLAPVWLQRASPYFGVLYAWAKAGEDPAARVETMLGALDASTRDELGAAAESDAFVSNTLAALPPAFRGPDVVLWTTRFLQLTQERLAPEEELGEETEGATHGA